MSEEEKRKSASMGAVLVTAVIVAGLVGAIAGYFAGSAGRAAAPAPQARTFHVFTSVLDFNETLEDTWGIPHDGFTPDTITVEKGDTVTIKFYNIETEPEDHTFTIGAPYSVNILAHAGENVNTTFVANTVGVFEFFCTFHLPTTTGHLVVLG